MARIICGISGIAYKCEHVPMTLSHRETAHPIFYLHQKKLLNLYGRYSEGNLTNTDSYLLFLALLHSTEAVKFNTSAIYHDRTQHIIAANIGQLVNVIFKSNAIQHPAFKQPKFIINQDTASLDNIKIWIKAWQNNISDFLQGISTERDRDKLLRVQNILSSYIKSPETKDAQLATAAANWACLAAEFPKHKAEAWKAIIRKCYNLQAMFSTPREELLAIKEHCESNLEVGSIYFHTLMTTLKTGISNHNDFLGFDNVNSSNSLGYTLLETDNVRQEAALLSMVASAPTQEPKREDYPSKFAFIRAKLAYKEAQKMNKANEKKTIKELKL